MDSEHEREYNRLLSLINNSRIGNQGYQTRNVRTFDQIFNLKTFQTTLPDHYKRELYSIYLNNYYNSKDDSKVDKDQKY